MSFFKNAHLNLLVIVLFIIAIPSVFGDSGESIKITMTTVPVEDKSGFPQTIAESSNELPLTNSPEAIEYPPLEMSSTISRGEPKQESLDLLPEPVLGKTSAEFEIIVFHDFTDRFSKKFFNTTHQELLENYEDKIKIVFRNFPLKSINPDSWIAALAGECAFEQGKFWQMHDLLFETTDYSVESLKSFAKVLGLNSKKFSECIESKKFFPEIQNDIDFAAKTGATGVPAFFVNGKKILGGTSLGMFESAMNVSESQMIGEKPLEKGKEQKRGPVMVGYQSTSSAGVGPPVEMRKLEENLVVYPFSGDSVKAEIVTSNEKVFVEKTLESRQITIESNNVKASTQKNVEISASGLVSIEGKEIKILPHRAVEKISGQFNIKEIKIEVSNEKLLYVVEGERSAKLLGLIPIKMMEKTFISAESGRVEKTEKPWWSFLAIESGAS